jgi:ADP-ribose pyrophosphatase YjhB (NUDIX family)
MKGKYNLKDIDYINLLFTTMAKDERNNLLTYSFDILWSKLWGDMALYNKKIRFIYIHAKNHFNLIRSGYYLEKIGEKIILHEKSKWTRETYPLNKNTLETNVFNFIPSTENWHSVHTYNKNTDSIFIDIETMIDNTTCYNETEWEFPKGHKEIYESQMNCAIRELREETNLTLSKDYIKDEIFEETYIGTNGNRYQNIYYIANYIEPQNNSEMNYLNNINKINNDGYLNTDSKKQMMEISKVEWFNIDEVITKLRKYYVHRIKLIKEINKYNSKIC